MAWEANNWREKIKFICGESLTIQVRFCLKVVMKFRDYLDIQSVIKLNFNDTSRQLAYLPIL